jgi:oligopeptide transport system permease protein
MLARKLAAQLVLLPIVALASYFLMAALPPPVLEQARTVVEQRAAVARYREDLGLDSPLGALRPWQRFFRGQRLGTQGRGVDGATIARKLAGSVRLGLVALAFALPLAFVYAAFCAIAQRGAFARTTTQGIAALAYATPVFIPAMLIAPRVVATSHVLENLAAALVLALWPGIYLGALLADAFRLEMARDYVRTAIAKGLPRSRAIVVHVVPNVVPVLLDALRPVATVLLAGSFAVEKVFGLHHFGELYVRAVIDRQTSVVVVCTTLFTFVLVVVGTLVEIARVYVDPRSRDERPG